MYILALFTNHCGFHRGKTNDTAQNHIVTCKLSRGQYSRQRQALQPQSVLGKNVFHQFVECASLSAFFFFKSNFWRFKDKCFLLEQQPLKKKKTQMLTREHVCVHRAHIWGGGCTVTV